MLEIPIQKQWLDAFITLFTLCKPTHKERIAIFSESHSRPVNVMLAEQALNQMGLKFTHISASTKSTKSLPIIRSTGATNAMNGESALVERIKTNDLVIDLSIEGMMHAQQTPSILASGTRVMTISNEHPDILTRLMPDAGMKDVVKEAVARCRAANTMEVTSPTGTDLTVQMNDTVTVGVWGWTDRPGTLAHWPGGLVVSFPRAASTNGQIVFSPGDINLTFKRYFESEVRCTVKDDFITSIDGSGTDAKLMRNYLAGFDDPLAYATSHVGWGLNPRARYEALCMYEKDDLNGTELRALAGNFLYSTGANEFASRFTEGHFDLPMIGCSISLDGILVVDKGVPC